MIFFFDIKSLYSSSAFSNIAITFLFTLFSSLHNSEKNSRKEKRENNQLSGLQAIRENVTESKFSRSQGDKNVLETQKITISTVILQ